MSRLLPALRAGAGFFSPPIYNDYAMRTLWKLAAWRVNGIASLKILHYSVVVCPKLPIIMSSSTNEGDILPIKQVAAYLKVTGRAITGWLRPN